MLRFLRPRGIRQHDLADAAGMTDSNLSMLIHGTRSIHPGMAWALAGSLGTTPRYWMDLQAEYDLWQARPESRFRRVRAAPRSSRRLRPRRTT